MNWEIWQCLPAQRRLELVELAESGEVGTTSHWLLTEMAGENKRNCECCKDQVHSVLTYEGVEMNPHAYSKTDCNTEAFALELIQAKWYVCVNCVINAREDALLGNHRVVFRMEALFHEYDRFTGMPTLIYDDILEMLHSSLMKLLNAVKEVSKAKMPFSVKWINDKMAEAL